MEVKTYRMKKVWMLSAILLGMSVLAHASDGDKFFQVGTGLLYERGWDLTFSVEQETHYHNAWEYFGNVYLKWEKCPTCHKVCSDSFWNSYNSWGLGIAYKPAVSRGRNSISRLRIGASAGSDRHDFLAGIHLGYEHDYATRSGIVLFWQVKSDVMIEGKDLFRNGLVLGIKFKM